MTDYSQPLADPVLEAAAQIYSILDDDKVSLNRRYIFGSEVHFRNAVNRIAKQIDHLRAIGAIPPAKSMSNDVQVGHKSLTINLLEEQITKIIKQRDELAMILEDLINAIAKANNDYDQIKVDFGTPAYAVACEMLDKLKE